MKKSPNLLATFSYLEVYKNYFFFIPEAASSTSLKAPVRCFIASTMLFASSGIFFEPNSKTKMTAIIINSLLPSPNISLFFSVNIKVARVWKIDFGSINNFGIILLIPLLGLLFILLFLAYYGWHKYFTLRKSVRKDLEQTQGRIKQEFKILSFEAVEEMNNVIKKGKSKVLTAKEKQSINSLKETISEVDESLHQLIQKIKDDVK